MLGKNFRSVTTNISKSLYHYSARFWKAKLGTENIKDIKSTKASSWSSSFRTANCYWLAGNCGISFVAGNLGIFIYHPRHYFWGSIHVWCGYIGMRSYNGSHLLYPTARKIFKFGFGKLSGVNCDTAFATTHRNVCNGTLESHPEG